MRCVFVINNLSMTTKTALS